jgi:hypothetical protein
MLRHCNGSDPNLKDDAGNVGNCGATFDDVNHWTTCPHDEFPISRDVWQMLARQDAAMLQGDDAEGRKEAARARYLAAAHAVQSGIAFLMQRNARLGDPKHLRVGIDTMKVEQGALATLLIARGVFTEVEYFEAMADAMEREKAGNEVQLTEMYGRRVTLS